jgi:drug/metabolite transporter (DMT)-like permease
MPEQSERRRQLIGALMVAVAATAFSAKGILIKLSYQHGVDTITLLALRMIFAAPFFAVFAWWAAKGSENARLTPAQKWTIAGVGLVGYYLASLFDFLGLQYITVALERLVLFLFPTFVVLYSALFSGYRIGRRDVFALSASYAGIALAFVNDLTTQQANVVLGTLWVLLSAICYAAYLIKSEGLIKRIGSVRYASLASLAATVGILAQFIVTTPVGALVNQAAPVYGWAFLMAIVATVMPIILTSAGIRRLGSSKTSMISTLGPVVTIFFGYLFLGEPITFLQLCGAVLVVAGVLVIASKRDSASQKPDAVGA